MKRWIGPYEQGCGWPRSGAAADVSLGSGVALGGACVAIVSGGDERSGVDDGTAVGGAVAGVRDGAAVGVALDGGAWLGVEAVAPVDSRNAPARSPDDREPRNPGVRRPGRFQLDNLAVVIGIDGVGLNMSNLPAGETDDTGREVPKSRPVRADAQVNTPARCVIGQANDTS
jgi:hypothetical protein